MGDRPKVGEILVKAGIIDELQLAAALGEQTRWGRRLGMTLVKLGMVQEGQLVRALARQFDLPVASLAGKKIAPDVLALVPAKFAIEHSVVPLFVKKDGPREQLFLGMEEPSDLQALDDLAFRTGMSIRAVMVAPTELGEAIDRYYAPRPATAARSGLPDPLRSADTLGESNLRSLRDEAAPTLSELLRPGPVSPHAGMDPSFAAEATRSVEPLDATPVYTALPDADTEPVVARAVRGDAPAAAVAATSLPPVAQNVPVGIAPPVMPPAPPMPPMPPIPAAPVVSEPSAPAASKIAPSGGATSSMTAPASVASAVDTGTSAAEVARLVEESERTRLVAKAIAHLLIEKGVLTLDELQARIEKLKPARPGPSA